MLTLTTSAAGGHVHDTACVGPRTFTEAREQWANSPAWKDTRPGMASQDWAEQGPGAQVHVPPDNITFGVVIYGVKNVDQINQVATIDMFLRTMWTDPRLAFAPASEGGCFGNPMSPEGELAFDGTPEGSIWTPGVAIMNIDEPQLVQYSSWWVYPSGFVFWSKKIQIKVKCDFDFGQLPYDTQMCPIRLVGWRDVDYDIAFQFHNSPLFPAKSEGMALEWNVTDLTMAAADPKDSGFIWGGQGLEWRLFLTRNPGTYESYVLVPIHMIICVTYLSFYISRYAVPARVAVVMICLLGLVNLSGGVRSNMPRSDQGCWLLDVITVGQAFVMIAAVEYAVANRGLYSACILMHFMHELIRALCVAQMANMLTRAETRMKAARFAQEKRREKQQGSHLQQKRAPTVSPAELQRAIDEEVDVVVQNGGAVDNGSEPDDDDQTIQEFGRLGRFMMCGGRARNMLVRDEHLDITCRYLFPPAYAIAVGILHAQV